MIVTRRRCVLAVRRLRFSDEYSPYAAMLIAHRSARGCNAGGALSLRSDFGVVDQRRLTILLGCVKKLADNAVAR